MSTDDTRLITITDDIIIDSGNIGSVIAVNGALDDMVSTSTKYYVVDFTIVRNGTMLCFLTLANNAVVLVLLPLINLLRPISL